MEKEFHSLIIPNLIAEQKISWDNEVNNLQQLRNRDQQQLT